VPVGASTDTSASPGSLKCRAIRGYLPLATLREVIQPFPAFSGVYVAGLQALHNAIMAERRPAGAGAR